MPHSLEFPRMLRAVVPLMRSRNALVHKFIAYRLPRFAAIVRALNNLSEPAARLRRVQTVRIGRRTFHVIQFPSGEMRSADFPVFSLPIRRQNERTFARP